nr:uncharacterized protein LOC110365547 isoform X2 [Columba livia]
MERSEKEHKHNLSEEKEAASHCDLFLECPVLQIKRSPQHPWTAGRELNADEKEKAKRSTESGNVLLPERAKTGVQGRRQRCDRCQSAWKIQRLCYHSQGEEILGFRAASIGTKHGTDVAVSLLDAKHGVLKTPFLLLQESSLKMCILSEHTENKRPTNTAANLPAFAHIPATVHRVHLITDGKTAKTVSASLEPLARLLYKGWCFGNHKFELAWLRPFVSLASEVKIWN